MPIALALSAACAAADRLIGWGGWGRTIPVALTILALAGIAYWMGLPPAGVATFPLAFLAWRTPGWTLFGGSINPAPGKAIFTFFRHALAFAFLGPAYLSGLELAPVALAIGGFAAGATLLGVINYLTLAKRNGLIETLRGALLGISLAFGYGLLQRLGSTGA